MGQNNNLDKQKNIDIFFTFPFQTSAVNPVLKTSAINPDLEKLCITYVASKSTQIIKYYKNITSANKKLEKVHANL